MSYGFSSIDPQGVGANAGDLNLKSGWRRRLAWIRPGQEHTGARTPLVLGVSAIADVLPRLPIQRLPGRHFNEPGCSLKSRRRPSRKRTFGSTRFQTPHGHDVRETTGGDSIREASSGMRVPTRSSAANSGKRN